MAKRTTKSTSSSAASVNGAAATAQQPATKKVTAKKAAPKPSVTTLREIKPVSTPRAQIDAHAAIARRAYEIYCERCAASEHGTPQSDWHRAEREVWASIAGR